jgi:hypothetical protein
VYLRGSEFDAGNRSPLATSNTSDDDSDDPDSHGPKGTTLEYSDYDDDEDNGPISSLPHVFIF